MRSVRFLAAAASVAMAGCTAAPPVRPAPIAAPVPQAETPTGLAAVMGRNARALEARFGVPELDVREGNARKLQFVSPGCVLDAYLYPPRQGAEPIVTHIDTRLPDGGDIDRASCVASFSVR